MNDLADVVRERDEDRRRVLTALYEVSSNRLKPIRFPHAEVYAKAGIDPVRGRAALDHLSRASLVMMMPSLHVALLQRGSDQVEAWTREEVERSGTLDEQEEKVTDLAKNIVRETETRLFISHAFDDRELAKALVDLIEHVLKVDTRAAIRCTSVVGYTLSPGSGAGETLRANLRDCDVVLGLLTPKSLESKYVLMELGAAWGFQKTAVPLLVGVSFADLPGPFKDVHAVQATSQAGVLSVLEVIENRCAMPKRTDAGRLVEKVGEFVALVSAAKASSVAVTPPPSPASPAETEVPDDAAKMKLVLWLESQERTATASRSPVDIVQVAKQAGVSVGQVDRLIGDAEVLGERWSVAGRGGGFVRLELAPARVRNTRGPLWK